MAQYKKLTRTISENAQIQFRKRNGDVVSELIETASPFYVEEEVQK